jgi:hypothetical protein
MAQNSLSEAEQWGAIARKKLDDINCKKRGLDEAEAAIRDLSVDRFPSRRSTPKKF